jgi:hypothetical protein
MSCGWRCESLEGSETATWTTAPIAGVRLSRARDWPIVAAGDAWQLLLRRSGDPLDTVISTFSAAIAAGLAKGCDVLQAIGRAKQFITEVIRNGSALGCGHGPMNHLVGATSKW